MNFSKFAATLPLMLQGMLGIFIVMVVIYLLILALNHVTGRKAADGAASRSDMAAPYDKK